MRLTVQYAAVFATPAAALDLLKPITWFPPMWAFGCGVLASGAAVSGQWLEIATGLLLVGPMVCGASQAVNDWFDRHVDAINQPERPIPSGRVPGHWGLYLALAWTAISLALAVPLGRWGVLATAAGLLLAWAYSAPPVRLKQNGWWGNAAVGLSYEGLAWVTGSAVMLNGRMPPGPILLLAGLYSLGAHGIMTLNDFKSIAGDQQMGIASLPVQLGPRRAAQVASGVMLVPQLLVVGLLVTWSHPVSAVLLFALVAAQVPLMIRMMAEPVARAEWYSACGVSLYVLGMLTSALALRAGAAL